MNKSIKLLKISAFINLFLGILTLKVPILREILLLTGFILFILSNEELSQKKIKKIIIIIAVILLPFNILVSILLFISIDNLNYFYQKNAPPKKNIIKDNDHASILLKIGIGMILISSLFLFNTWTFISNQLKIAIILILGFIFLILSNLIEKKTKNYHTTYLYWFLSIIFLILSIIGILYFGLFSNFITYQGIKNSLAYAITFFVVTNLLFATYLKFSKNYLLYFTYLFATLMLFSIFKYFNLSNNYIFLIFSIIIFLINLISKKNSKLFNYTKLLSFLMLAFQLYCINSNNFLIPISCLINILNNYNLITKEKDNLFIKINLIITSAFIFISICNINFTSENKCLILSILLFINLILTRSTLLKLDKKILNFNFILYLIAIFPIYIISFFENSLINLIISIILFTSNYISSVKIFNLKSIKIAKKIEPLTIFFLILSLTNINIIKSLEIFSNIGIIIVVTIILVFIHLLLKNTKQKKIYMLFIAIGFIISLINFDKLKDYETILLFIPSIYLFYRASFIKKENKTFSLTYFLLIYTIYSIIIKANLLSIAKFYSLILLIFILIMLLIFIKNTKLKKITNFSFILPLYSFLNEIFLSTELNIIIESIMILYITYFIFRFFCKTNESKNLIAITGIILSLQSLIYEDNYIFNLYIGIIGLLIIMISYNHKNIFPIFITGILITIINILNSFKYIFEKSPFWLYFLIIGLGIIIFVTYKELKNKDI